MAGRGPQTFQKRQKEQQRKERQQEKMARRLERKHQKQGAPEDQGETHHGVRSDGSPEQPAPE
jgi:hypothetical protein